MLRERYATWGFAQEDFFLHKIAIRINTAQFEEKKICNTLKGKNAILEKIPFLEAGYYITAQFNLSSSIEYLTGAIYIQEPPAQIPAELFDNLQDKKVWDMCAAPGGKTTQLAERMHNTGVLVATEPDSQRAQKLLYNIERMRSRCIVKIQKAEEEKEMFDCILLDAPCSGNYTQEPNWFEKRTIKDILSRQEIQKNLIDVAWEQLIEKGMLVYSTCSLEKEENEDIVEYALEKGFVLQKIPLSIGHKGLTPLTELCVRIWPTQDKLPGFFIAKLQKP